MTGTRISDMTHLGSLPASGARVPLVKDGDSANYTYDLAADLAGRPTSAALAANAGASLISTLLSGTGAVARTVADKITDTISVKDFGAKGDSNVAGSVGTDDTAAFQAALNYASTLAYGAVYVPAAYYKLTGKLNIPLKVRMTGSGRYSSVLVFTHVGAAGADAGATLANGSGIVSGATATKNGVTVSGSQIDHLGVINTNASCNGAGFYDSYCNYLYVQHCWFKGWKFGNVFDQSEIVRVRDNVYDPCAGTGGACVWVVNGSDLHAGTLTTFTNDLTFEGNQFNSGAGNTCVADDGGVTRLYQSNNYNGGVNALRLIGVTVNCIIQGGEYEAQSSNIVEFAAATFNPVGTGATATGACSATIIGGTFTATTQAGVTNNAIHLSQGTHLTIIGGSYAAAGGTNNPVGGAGNANSFALVGYVNNTSSAFVSTETIGTGNYTDLTQLGLSTTALKFAGSIKSTGTTGVGYGTGAGGTATQATSRTTTVAINKPCGQITLFSAAGSATWQSFTVSNAVVAATDVIHVVQSSGTDIYQIMVTNVAAGSFKISFATTGGTTTEQPVFNFAVTKTVTA